MPRKSLSFVADKAITIHFPWAWAIVNGYKKVENRDWRTQHRGPLLIHSGTSTESDLRAAQILNTLGVAIPALEQFVRGHIIGAVDLVDVLPLAEYLKKFGGSPLNRGLAFGKYCWVLENPRKCDPIPCGGNFFLWSAVSAIKRRKANPSVLLNEKKFTK